ncbi:hypothetical protein [Fodinicola feengrottensis]|uniref:hypothetical protein n=1 Tax=Fodinicola feengrottensis TaxID=435914 RepID=UPI0013D375E2|nr:hypothetical protein [Fodinicola feengrottensis]
MGDGWERVQEHAQGMTSTKRWSGYAGLVWALAYIPIHIYWAFGGSAAFLGLARTNADFQIANWGASVVLLGAGLTAFALVRPWGRLLPRWGGCWGRPGSARSPAACISSPSPWSSCSG